MTPNTPWWRQAAIFLMLGSCAVVGGNAAAQPNPNTDDPIRAELQATIAQYESAHGEYRKTGKTLKSREERLALRKKLLPPVPNAMRFVEWANAHSKDQLAFEGLLLIVNRGPFTSDGKAAATVLATSYLDVAGSQFQRISTAMLGTPPAVAELALRPFVEKSSVRATRGKACWSLGMNKAQVLYWVVNLLPTVYVLDHKGVIRFKHLRGERLLDAVDSLLAEINIDGQ